MKFLSVDRIGKEYIVCEDENGEVHVIPVKNLPKDIKEGSIVDVDAKGEVKLNTYKTDLRKNIVVNLREKVYNVRRKTRINF